ncbi:hypothetical protein D3C77_767240 [compost metagenome]
MLTRHEKYNETVSFCEQLESEGNAVIIRPERPLRSFEKDINILKDSCQHGYDLTMTRMPEIQGLFG